MNFKKVLSFFLTGATALSMTTAALAADDTPIMLPADVASQDWYAPAVRYVMEYDLMDVGHPENGAPVFEPSRTVSRQEVADAIYRAACRLSEKFAAEPSQSGISGMADYAEIGQDYYNAMAFCYENGIMTGSGKKLNPGAAITRQEFAAVLQRTMKLFAENGLAEIVPGDGMAVYEFSDSRSIQDWAISPVSFCIKNHLMQGNADNTFSPTGNVSRAQLAQTLNNISTAAKK